MPDDEQDELDHAADGEIIPLRLAITAMRDSGYKNTAYALAELIDNSIQAGATTVELLCIEKREMVSSRERRRLNKVAVLDNGSGMDAVALRKALQFGNGSRLNDRSGIGRFGMGLPNASISQARRIDVWSWQNGPDNAIHTNIDLASIGLGTMRLVPDPTPEPVPMEWRTLAQELGISGTLVVWSELDADRLTWKGARHTLLNTERVVGRIYRRFILNESVTIRLFAKEEGESEAIHDRPAGFDDPLYLTPSPAMPEPFNTQPMFVHAFDDPQVIEVGEEKHTVNVRYSIASQETIARAGTKNRGDTAYGRHAAGNIGVSVLRAGREIMLDPGWCIGYDPRERWWGAEIEFPPALDELFGVTNNKQAATHFSEMAATDWQQLADDGEEFIDVVTRLKDDGDPRGWLLSLSDSIKRSISRLRNEIKGQSAGTRSTRSTRHNKPDAVTAAVNKSWEERSKERPIEGEKKPNSPEDLENIREDLTKNKHYSEADADKLISVIKEDNLKVVFLEADFPSVFDLFNVEIKGQTTEVTFNRKHPAFDDIFGTVSTADEDVNDLSNTEILDRLERAINAIRITFAAWARYEREAGVSKAQALEGVRHDWGQIAAKFLQSEDGLL